MNIWRKWRNDRFAAGYSRLVKVANVSIEHADEPVRGKRVALYHSRGGLTFLRLQRWVLVFTPRLWERQYAAGRMTPAQWRRNQP